MSSIPSAKAGSTLEAIKSEVGSLMFSAQYQQRPVAVESNLIRRSWFPAYDNLPQSPLADKDRAELGRRLDDGRSE